MINTMVNTMDTMDAMDCSRVLFNDLENRGAVSSLRIQHEASLSVGQTLEQYQLFNIPLLLKYVKNQYAHMHSTTDARN